MYIVCVCVCVCVCVSILPDIFQCMCRGISNEILTEVNSGFMGFCCLPVYA